MDVELKNLGRASALIMELGPNGTEDPIEDMVYKLPDID